MYCFYGVRRIQLSCISSHILLTTCRSWWSLIGAVFFSGILMVVCLPNLLSHLENMSTPDNDTPGDIPDEPFTPRPGPQPPSQFPPAIAAPSVPDSLAPLTPVQPDTPVVPTLVVPPNIPDEHMTSPEKRQLRRKLVLLCQCHRRLTRLHLHRFHRATISGVMINSHFRRPNHETKEEA